MYSTRDRPLHGHLALDPEMAAAWDVARVRMGSPMLRRGMTPNKCAPSNSAIKAAVLCIHVFLLFPPNVYYFDWFEY